MAFFDDYYVEAQFDSVTWVDFKRDIVSTVFGKYGICGNGVMDRIADIGELKFETNNTKSNSAGLVGYYSPGHLNCRSGFYPGLNIRMRFVLDGNSVVKWTGAIPKDGIDVQTGNFSARRVSVNAKDWMYQTSIHQMKGVAFAQNKTIAEGVPLVLANMLVQPPGTITYFTPESTFPSIFDSTKETTTALSELSKMVLSELGYLYLTRLGLTVEGRLTRNEEKTTLDSYPKSSNLLDYLGCNDDYIITDHGKKILLTDSYYATFSNAQKDMKVSYGKNYFNNVKFRVYPRKVDASATSVLFTLQSPMEIIAGETYVLTGAYKDPAGKASSVSGVSMVTPVATTHYLQFANKDGTGTNQTTSMTVGAVFGTGEFTVSVSSVATGWLTKLQLVGKGVYLYEPVEYYTEDATAMETYGNYGLVFDMKLQDDPSVAKRWAHVTSYQYKSFNMSIEDVLFDGKSKELLAAFLYIEPGARINFTEDVSGLSGDFFVHGISWSMDVGGNFQFSWILREVGLDTFNFVKWTSNSVPVAGYGTWDDLIYGWDF